MPASVPTQEAQTPQLLNVPSGDASGLTGASLAALGLGGQHVLSVSTFKRDQLHQLFNFAHSLRSAVQHRRRLDNMLKVLIELHIGTIKVLFIFVLGNK